MVKIEIFIYFLSPEMKNIVQLATRNSRNFYLKVGPVGYQIKGKNVAKYDFIKFSKLSTAYRFFNGKCQIVKFVFYRIWNVQKDIWTY